MRVQSRTPARRCGRRRCCGTEELRRRRARRSAVRCDSTRAMYSTDASNYRQVPIGLVVPKDARRCRARRSRRAADLARPSSRAAAARAWPGETCNAAVVIDFSKYMHRILDDRLGTARQHASSPAASTTTCAMQPKQRHLTYGPDPATHSRNTFGGMIGNNSCGMHAQMAGKTEENVEELEIVTYDGLRMRVGPTSGRRTRAHHRGRRPARRNLRSAASDLRDKYADKIRAALPRYSAARFRFRARPTPARERLQRRARAGRNRGTCVTVVEATVRLVHSPPYRDARRSWVSGSGNRGRSRAVLRRTRPIALEGMAASMFHYMELKGESECRPRALSRGQRLADLRVRRRYERRGGRAARAV